MLGWTIKSNDGASLIARTTLTSAPFTIALTAVPVAVPKSMLPPDNVELPEIVLLLIVSVPALTMPPP